MTSPVERFTHLLGYVGDRGYVAADAFAHQPNHRHALRLAAQDMGIQGAFGLWTGREGALLAACRAEFSGDRAVPIGRYADGFRQPVAAA